MNSVKTGIIPLCLVNLTIFATKISNYKFKISDSYRVFSVESVIDLKLS